METPAKETNRLALTQLVPGPHQPRKNFDEAALAELAASVKNQGVVQPLIVRATADTTPQLYEIVAGAWGWRAAKMAGLTDVPVVITTYSDDEAMTIALIENLQREDLNAVEEAQALASLKDVYGLSQEELAAKLGKSRSAIANSLRLLQLPEAVLVSLGQGEISAGHARTLLAITDEAVLLDLHSAVLAKGLSVREVETAADVWKKTGALPGSLRDAPAKEARVRAPKPGHVKKIQKLLRAAGHKGAVIGGDGEKGKISLPYSSHAELLSLLGLLGLADAEAPAGRHEGLSDLMERADREPGDAIPDLPELPLDGISPTEPGEPDRGDLEDQISASEAAKATESVAQESMNAAAEEEPSSFPGTETLGLFPDDDEEDDDGPLDIMSDFAPKMVISEEEDIVLADIGQGDSADAESPEAASEEN